MEQKPIVSACGQEFQMAEWFIDWQRYMNRLTPEGRRLATERLSRERVVKPMSRWLNLQPTLPFDDPARQLKKATELAMGYGAESGASAYKRAAERILRENGATNRRRE